MNICQKSSHSRINDQAENKKQKEEPLRDGSSFALSIYFFFLQSRSLHKVKINKLLLLKVQVLTVSPETIVAALVIAADRITDTVVVVIIN